MLINKYYSNVLPLARETIECAFDGGGFGFGVDDEEVFLGVGGFGYVLCMLVRPSDIDVREVVVNARRRLQAGYRLLSPMWILISLSLTRSCEEMVRPTSSPITAMNCRSLYSD